MRAQAGLVAAVAHRPELLILDEPSSGLDAVVRRDILDAIVRTVADDGRTVIFSSHLLDEVERMSDHVTMIHHGRVTLSGALDDVRRGYQRSRVRFVEHFDQPPALDAALAMEGGGRTWSVLHSGSIEQFHLSVLALGGEVVESRDATLEEIFLARAGRGRQPWRPRDHAVARHCHPVGKLAAVAPRGHLADRPGDHRGSGRYGVVHCCCAEQSHQRLWRGDRPGPRSRDQPHWVAVILETERRTARLSVLPPLYTSGSDGGIRRRPAGVCVTVAPAAIYLVSVLLLRVTFGYPFPLLPVAAWIAALNLVMAAANWSTRNRVVQMLGAMAAGVAWIGLADHRLTGRLTGTIPRIGRRRSSISRSPTTC